MLTLSVGNFNTSRCWPAGRGMDTKMVLKICQSPVFGTETFATGVVPLSTYTRIDDPKWDEATLSF